MKFDAPIAMMLGVVGLGAFAVYKLTQTKASEPQTTAPTGGILPASLQLKQGVKYQGRLSLKALDVPPLASTGAQLAQFLQLLGFRDVAVYMTSAELPFNWSELREGDSSNRWFEGTWSNASLNLPRPKQIDRLSANGQPLISGLAG